jgi:methyl-accepting chemotaxis protein
MSTPRRRRWLDTFRRSAGSAVHPEPLPATSLEDAALFSAHERAVRSVEASDSLADNVEVALARQRSSIEDVAERVDLVATRSDGLGAVASRVAETFDRLGVIALNAGLEGARVAEPQGRALLLLAEEIRVNLSRGIEAARDLATLVDEISTETSQVRMQIERARADAAEAGQEAAKLRAVSHQASKALGDLDQHLRRATGIDPEIARAVALASEHARGLITALSALSAAAPAAPVLSALRPAVSPLVRLLREIWDEDGPGDVAARPEGPGGGETSGGDLP